MKIIFLNAIVLSTYYNRCPAEFRPYTIEGAVQACFRSIPFLTNFLYEGIQSIFSLLIASRY